MVGRVCVFCGGILDEAMEHPVVRPFFDKVETTEIVPPVPPVPGTDLRGYYRLIARRFSNPKIGDTIRRLCLDGSNRQPKFVIPSIADRLARGLTVEARPYRPHVTLARRAGAARAFATEPAPIAWTSVGHALAMRDGPHYRVLRRWPGGT